MLKVYKTQTYLSMPITVKGKSVRIEFRGNKFTGGFFSTKDKNVQKAIESSKEFNDIIFLDAVEEEPVKEKEDRRIKIESVKSFQEAVEYLKGEGIIAKTPEEINSAAEELNISFPNLK